jgi:hypothetical protein
MQSGTAGQQTSAGSFWPFPGQRNQRSFSDGTFRIDSFFEESVLHCRDLLTNKSRVPMLYSAFRTGDGKFQTAKPNRTASHSKIIGQRRSSIDVRSYNSRRATYASTVRDFICLPQCNSLGGWEWENPYTDGALDGSASWLAAAQRSSADDAPECAQCCHFVRKSVPTSSGPVRNQVSCRREPS